MEIVPLDKTMELMRGISASPLVYASTLGLDIGGAETNSGFVGDLNAAYRMRQGAGGIRDAEAIFLGFEPVSTLMKSNRMTGCRRVGTYHFGRGRQ
ncbi:hypothetical protein CIK76_16505 [Glutamicibacter sp. BW80]|uniref:hypothetical protein n=1 Tax=unclassified Glutamicibacter TaxID=2627139 RepID=UPI000BB85F8B|nr:hypothetical protein [Glutamicibacter sp. BW80]PCC27549.1 hypothetical protein CIK76_16505 [Glutamicibacter sp. BW80]